MTRITDQNGTLTDQGFDDLDRLIGRDLTLASGVGGDTTEDFAYDALNRLTEAADDDSIVQLTYDSLSRVLTEVQGSNPLAPGVGEPLVNPPPARDSIGTAIRRAR